MRSSVVVRSLAALAVVVASVGSGLAAASAAPAQASPSSGSCEDGIDPTRYPPGENFTVDSVLLRGKPDNTLIELRAHDIFKEHCEWGKLTSGRVGDLVWVDRSYDGGTTWAQLGITRVDTGKSNHTPGYAPGLMRACGLPAGGRPQDVRCTPWS
ncbi:hypothetical protein [Amycolatopsis silviterrae]|uniref:SH3 domain-containing protein n=1 Tax=Amycolatopsis silviterrae TaxID=1656914 RepID=A0ABW5H3L9_9PSEU